MDSSGYDTQATVRASGSMDMGLKNLDPQGLGVEGLVSKCLEMESISSVKSSRAGSCVLKVKDLQYPNFLKLGSERTNLERTLSGSKGLVGFDFDPNGTSKGVQIPSSKGLGHQSLISKSEKRYVRDGKRSSSTADFNSMFDLESVASRTRSKTHLMEGVIRDSWGGSTTRVKNDLVLCSKSPFKGLACLTVHNDRKLNYPTEDHQLVIPSSVRWGLSALKNLGDLVSPSDERDVDPKIRNGAPSNTCSKDEGKALLSKQSGNRDLGFDMLGHYYDNSDEVKHNYDKGDGVFTEAPSAFMRLERDNFTEFFAASSYELTKRLFGLVKKKGVLAGPQIFDEIFQMDTFDIGCQLLRASNFLKCLQLYVVYNEMEVPELDERLGVPQVFINEKRKRLGEVFGKIIHLQDFIFATGLCKQLGDIPLDMFMDEYGRVSDGLVDDVNYETGFVWKEKENEDREPFKGLHAGIDLEILATTVEVENYDCGLHKEGGYSGEKPSAGSYLDQGLQALEQDYFLGENKQSHDKISSKWFEEIHSKETTTWETATDSFGVVKKCMANMGTGDDKANYGKMMVDNVPLTTRFDAFEHFGNNNMQFAYQEEYPVRTAMEESLHDDEIKVLYRKRIGLVEGMRSSQQLEDARNYYKSLKLLIEYSGFQVPETVVAKSALRGSFNDLASELFVILSCIQQLEVFISATKLRSSHPAENSRDGMDG